ncbi:MAG: GerW family sporulation protein [Oscillospiraceae bacterium]|jgi:sporulation protein YtfJ|nr:GerW family sporulation protein [Oscillospiraceae bacterium]
METKSAIADLMTSTMSKIRDMVDVNTIVGDAITTADGTTVIPVSKLSMGFGSGGSEFGAEKNFGGGSGAGIKVAPVAFLVVNEHSVRLLPVAGSPETAFDKIADLLPKVTKQIEHLIDKRKAREETE